MATSAQPRWAVIVQWILRILMAGLFGYAAFRKLTGDPEMVREFGLVGLGQWFRYFVALFEVAGVIALLTPTTVRYGALALLTVDIGALVVQITILHGDFIHCIVIGLILAAILWLQQRQVTGSVAPAL